MLSNCENIIKNKLFSESGWDKVNGNRVIAIGNMVNCNGEILYDVTINKDLESIATKYNLKNYKIYPISTKYMKASVLSLDDENYDKLKSHILE